MLDFNSLMTVLQSSNRDELIVASKYDSDTKVVTFFDGLFNKLAIPALALLNLAGSGETEINSSSIRIADNGGLVYVLNQPVNSTDIISYVEEEG